MHPLEAIRLNARPTRPCALCRKPTSTPALHASTGLALVCGRAECTDTLAQYRAIGLTPRQINAIITTARRT